MLSEQIKEALIVSLGNISPSSVISQGWEEIFHVFFSKGTQDEVDQLLPPDCRYQSQNHSQTILDPTAASQQCTPTVSSQPQNKAARENTGQTYAIFHKNNHNPESILNSSEHHRQHTFNSLLRRAPNVTSTIHNDASINGVSGSHSQINCVSRLIDKPTDTENIVAKTPDESLREQVQSCPRAWKAVQGIENSMPRKPEFYRNVWAGREKLQFSARDSIDRYAALQRILAHSEMDATTTRYKQRMTLLLGSHELEAIEKSLTEDERLKKITSRSPAITKLARFLKKDKKEIIYENKKRRHYVHVYKRVGPGALLLLGEHNNITNLWENALRDDEVDLVLKYAERFLPEWNAKCRELQFEAARLIIDGLLTCGWDKKSDYDTEFMKHLGNFIDLDVFQNDERLQPVEKVSGRTTTEIPIVANVDPPNKRRRIDGIQPATGSANCSSEDVARSSGLHFSGCSEISPGFLEFDLFQRATPEVFDFDLFQRASPDIHDFDLFRRTFSST